MESSGNTPGMILYSRSSYLDTVLIRTGCRRPPPPEETFRALGDGHRDMALFLALAVALTGFISSMWDGQQTYAHGLTAFLGAIDRGATRVSVNYVSIIFLIRSHNIISHRYIYEHLSAERARRSYIPEMCRIANG